jgi:hypothetical protein
MSRENKPILVVDDEAHGAFGADPELIEKMGALVRAGRDERVLLPAEPGDYRQYDSLETLEREQR